eukprot:gnl/MRDRNA2_/MRDRNA2_34875_c0_seq1.p1 gnl/MRDRNA2_/MRDRNA2_34875_c0~~gnl/MRDRNA2_/MRDRNA2_34875_c0_seq1.p1  ORF type:complete len:324 (+),score=57.12 gnl/MRDRNA2_/MRDRNA2_34875_c0_seq1:170-1141(+)
MSINIGGSSVYKIVNSQQQNLQSVRVDEPSPTQFTMLRSTTPPRFGPYVTREVSAPLVREVSVVPQANYDGVIREMREQIAGLHAQLKMEIRSREQAEITFSANLSATKKDLQLQIDEMQRGQSDLITEVKRLARSLQREKEDREMLEVKNGELENAVETLKAHLSELDFFATNELQKALHLIEMRGNIQVNFDTGDVQLLRPLVFQPRTTKDTPNAAFTQPGVASAICQDIAEVMKLFDCSIEVEGHTKGGEGEFWQTLANERARVVVEKMVEFGANADKITSRGKPGTLGLNETRTVVHMLLSADSREQAVRRRSSLISLG